MDISFITGEYLYSKIYRDVYYMHDVLNNVNTKCLQYYDELHRSAECFMAPYTLSFIETPIFIMNSLVDSWQEQHIMGLTCDLTVINAVNSSK